MSGEPASNAARSASRRHRKIPAFQATGVGPASIAAAASAEGFSTKRETTTAPSSPGIASPATMYP